MPQVKRTMKIKTNSYHLEGNTDKLRELTSSEGVSWGCSTRNRRWRGIKCLAGSILTSGSVPVEVTYGVVKKNPKNSSLWHKGFIWVSFKARAPMPDYKYTSHLWPCHDLKENFPSESDYRRSTKGQFSLKKTVRQRRQKKMTMQSF